MSAGAGEEVRVLVVDDEMDARESLKALLELDGYKVFTAGGAEDAMGALAEHDPDCVILDLAMPKVGGAMLAQRIRAERGSHIVLIVLTGSVLDDDHRDAEMAGVDYVLRKPLDALRLHRMLPPIT